MLTILKNTSNPLNNIYKHILSEKKIKLFIIYHMTCIEKKFNVKINIFPLILYKNWGVDCNIIGEPWNNRKWLCMLIE